MSAALIETAVSEFGDEAAFKATRAAFEERCGELSPNDPWFDERMAFLYTLYAWQAGADGVSPLQRYASAMKRPLEERELARALSCAQRGLYIMSRRGPDVVAIDGMRHGRFRLASAGLMGAELFDGFLYGTAHGTRIAPGAIFYPPTARSAILGVLAEAHRLELSVDHTCDALLRMKMRGERTERMDPAIAFRPDALDAMNTSSAGWRVAESPE